MSLKYGAAAVLFVSAAFAQQFEIGGLVGYGFYNNVSASSSTATLQAGLTNQIVGGAVLCEDLYEHFSGEVRYLYQDGHPFVSGPSFRAETAGHSQTLTYDMLFHVFDRDHRVRPFVAAGVGGKYFRVGDVASPLVSAPQLAVLVNAGQWRVVGDFGLGVKFRLQRHVIFRAEIRDYISPFPSRQVALVGNGVIHGILNDITPLVGLSYSF